MYFSLTWLAKSASNLCSSPWSARHTTREAGLVGTACDWAGAIAHAQTQPFTNEERPLWGLIWFTAGMEVSGSKSSESRDTLLVTVLHKRHHAPHPYRRNTFPPGQSPRSLAQNHHWEPSQGSLLLVCLPPLLSDLGTGNSDSLAVSRNACFLSGCRQRYPQPSPDVSYQ